jgi:hypothetical protein
MLGHFKSSIKNTTSCHVHFVCAEYFWSILWIGVVVHDLDKVVLMLSLTETIQLLVSMIVVIIYILRIFNFGLYTTI